MKKILSTVAMSALLLGFSMNADAMMPKEKMGCDGKAPCGEKMMEMREKRDAKMAEELKLTPEQKTQAEKIRSEGREKMKPLMEDMKAHHEKMEAVRKQNMDEFEKILTPEQKEKFEKIKADRPERMRGRKDKMNKGEHKKGMLEKMGREGKIEQEVLMKK